MTCEQTYTTDAGSQDVKKKLLREYNRDKRRNKRDSLGGIVSAKDKVSSVKRYLGVPERLNHAFVYSRRNESKRRSKKKQLANFRQMKIKSENSKKL